VSGKGETNHKHHNTKDISDSEREMASTFPIISFGV
jgi:hypothetical protein